MQPALHFSGERPGVIPAADARLLTGVLFRLGAAEQAKAFYQELSKSAEFTSAAGWAELDVGEFEGLLLPGGHAPGMRQYLGSPAGRSAGRVSNPTGVIESTRVGPGPGQIAVGERNKNPHDTIIAAAARDLCSAK